MTIERRKNKRYQTPGLYSNISDGKKDCFVLVNDVSKSGVGLAHVPEGFDESVGECSAVINAPLKDMKLVLRPRWVMSSQPGKYKRIGFEISEPSREWQRFIEELKSDKHKKTRAKKNPPG